MELDRWLLSGRSLISLMMFIVKVEEIVREWQIVWVSALEDSGTEVEGTLGLYKVHQELPYDSKNYGIDYYFQVNNEERSRGEWEDGLLPSQLCQGIVDFLVVSPMSMSGVVLDAPGATLLLSTMAVALSNCGSARYETDRLGSCIPEEFSQLVGLYKFFNTEVPILNYDDDLFDELAWDEDCAWAEWHSVEDPVKDSLNVKHLMHHPMVPQPTVLEHVIKDLFEEDTSDEQGGHINHKAIKAAPLDSLISLFCLHALQFDTCNIRAIAVLWIDFVWEVRWCWDEGYRLPRALTINLTLVFNANIVQWRPNFLKCLFSPLYILFVGFFFPKLGFATPNWSKGPCFGFFFNGKREFDFRGGPITTTK
uniref:Uncharacterized protein n=1 Tax=Physcomitrium patens TaxID=3218 RepID=A0A2K1J386_PHYPA|nr:hypothetical protein PHYPA_021834 [Physcomitrium patens]